MDVQDPTAGLTDQERADFWLNRRHKKLPYMGHRLAFRITGGRLGGTRRGVTCGLLSTIGRRSGRTRTVPVMFLEDGSRLLVVAANSGFDQAPAWYLNLKANPSATFRTPKATFDVVARELADTERSEAWERVVRFNPIYRAFQACTVRTLAIVALERRVTTASS
jgi:deazaflavin-dependent oxidoreductase (nitroreductase family)